MSLVDLQIREGWVEARLNRPERRNALSSALADELVEGIQRAESYGSGMVLAANGPVFCAGADLSEGLSLDGDRPSTRVTRALLETPLFVVALVEAGVYGAGISIISACPVVVATPGALVGLPESKHGFFPVGVVPWLEARVAPRRLVQLGMTAGSLTAEEAYGLGLFTELVEPADIDQSVERWMTLVRSTPEVALDAKRYWASTFDDQFHSRVAKLESLLSGRLALATGHTVPPIRQDPSTKQGPSIKQGTL
jgi:enoyl-CoA hydratase